MRKKNKKAALELSITTIVVVVIAVIMLIMGLVLVRTIMCGAMDLTTGAIDAAKKEIDKLFREQTDAEVLCVGAGTTLPIMIPGEVNFVFCTIKSERGGKYSLDASDMTFQGKKVERRWIVSEDWSGDVPPGETPIKVARIDIPKDAPEGMLTIHLKAKRDGDVLQPLDLDFSIKRVGWARNVIC